MKLLIGFCVLALSSILGYLYAQKYEKRYKFYFSFSSFNKKIMNEAYFTQKSVKSILSESDNEDDFYKIADQYFTKAENKIDYKYLNEEDKKYLFSYLKCIGGCDRDTQIKFVNISEEELKQRVKLSFEEKKKYFPLYIKLGFLIGLIMFIVFI